MQRLMTPRIQMRLGDYDARRRSPFRYIRSRDGRY